jgi:hypothetical protein
MNKHIEDLAIEYCSQMVWDSPDPPSEFTFSREAIVKFAEMIVIETAKVYIDKRFDNDLSEYNYCLDILNEHFGVE